MPRTLAQRKQQFQQQLSGHQSPLFSNNNPNQINSSSTNNQSKDYINITAANKITPSGASKQGIYQKSLNLITNGVSPLLKKRQQQQSSQPNHYESFNLTKNLIDSRAIAKPATVINSNKTSTNNYSNQQQINPASQLNHHLLTSPTLPVNHPTIVGSTSLSNNLGGQSINSNNNFKATNRLSTAEILVSSPTLNTNPNINDNCDPRRKSESIMLSLDATSNEFDRLQQRQELMLENLNLDFETMLMNGNTAVVSSNNNLGNNNSNQTNNGNQQQLNNMNNMIQMHHHQLLFQQQQQQQQQHNNQPPPFNSTQSHLINSNVQQQNQQQLNGTNVIVHSNLNDGYGRTIQQPKLHPQGIHLQQQQQQNLQSNFNNSSSNKPPIHPTQHVYKEPMYLMYDDPNNQQQQQQNNQQGQNQHFLQQSQHKSSKNDENIYEEVDFMSLSSLRAQYADTLSLQSWKKKGSKRGLSSATSSSFTRWFSTRKKNSPSNSTTISNTISNSNSHTDLDENTYFEHRVSITEY